MRIIAQEELDAACVEHSIERWRGFCEECADLKTSAYGCTQFCVRSHGKDWTWHGIEGERPTPESIFVTKKWGDAPVSCERHTAAWANRAGITDYAFAVHARAVTLARAITGDFDEEAERSRLQMVPA